MDVNALVDRCWRLWEHSCQQQHALSHCNHFNCHIQVFIGIAGAPGSGKSYVAEQVARAINQRHNEEQRQRQRQRQEPEQEQQEHSPPQSNDNAHDVRTKPDNDNIDDNDIAIVIPMDGYHFTWQQLKEMADQGTYFASDQWNVNDSDNDDDNDDNDTDRTVTKRQLSYEQLLARRGASFTYCPQAFVRDLRRAKQTGQGSFPKYDREQHDPVSNAITLHSDRHKIVLIEGLYLLCLDDPQPWAPLQDLWDDKWYITVGVGGNDNNYFYSELKRRLIQRHLKHWNDEKTRQFGGKDKEAAAKKAESNYLINAQCIHKHSPHHANLIIVNKIKHEENDTNHNSSNNKNINKNKDDDDDSCWNSGCRGTAGRAKTTI
ncbi:hypothetical protein ACA910_011720 [Epithemia clementina (nom. ined.)]